MNLAHYFPYDVKFRLLAHRRSFLANQKARNVIVGAENLLKCDILAIYDVCMYVPWFLRVSFNFALVGIAFPGVILR